MAKVIKTHTHSWPWLRPLFAGLTPQGSGFVLRSIHVGFVVDKVALGSFRVAHTGATINNSDHTGETASSGNKLILSGVHDEAKNDSEKYASPFGKAY
jgi:hypothetical protein